VCNFYVVENLIVRCINPGILSIASYLDTKDYRVEILDMSEDTDFSALTSGLKEEMPWIVGVSRSTGFNYLSSMECARIAKQLCPEALVIAGGQHVGPLGMIAPEECPWFDVVVKYEGELVTEQLLEQYGRQGSEYDCSAIPGIAYRHDGRIAETRGYPGLLDLNEAPFPNHELYPDFRKFNPYVEESRGCFFHCRYCTSNFTNEGVIRVKKHDRFLAELEHALALYGTGPIYPKLLASTFGTNVENTLRIAEGIGDLGIRWTSGFRVDSPWAKYLDELYRSGFRICSAGLESASAEILERMGKTRKPTVYLERAQRLIDAVSRHDGLMLKIKIMFYIGETPKTIKESLHFLLKNSHGIAEVQCPPVFAFPGVPFLQNLSDLEVECGCSLIRRGDWERVHIYPVKPSRYFTFEEIAGLSNTLEEIFSPEHIYYEVNQYTYGLEDEDEIRENGRKGSFRPRDRFSGPVVLASSCFGSGDKGLV